MNNCKTLTIFRTMRAHAIVDIEETFTVPETTYNNLLADGYTPEEAFDQVRAEGNAVRTASSNDIAEVTAVHETTVEEVDDGVVPDGFLSKADYKTLAKILEVVKAKHGELKLCIEPEDEEPTPGELSLLCSLVEYNAS